MIVREGRGYLLRTGVDAPFGGWIGIRQLDAAVSIYAAPWEALRCLGDLARLMPGGLALLWNAPTDWFNEFTPEIRAGFLKGICHLPGLSLHICDERFGSLLHEPAAVWHHARRQPSGSLGLAWRHGWLGWIPDSGPGWSLPGLGHTGDDPAAGSIWGELLLPVGALEHLDPADLGATLAEQQARMEQGLSLRMGEHAWPAAFPFQRRRAGWRVGFLGGREFQAAGGSWEQAADRAGHLAAQLAEDLRCPIHLAACADPTAALRLGQQAMWEGLPWRTTLPLPPAPPSFTPGLGADPREPSPLESRCAFPAPLARLMGECPPVLLRLPGVPMEGAVGAFLAGLEHVPALRWLPPDLPAPGPFLPELPWAPAADFPPLADAAQMLQPSLFEEFE